MLQYVYDHKVDILRNIDLPQVIDDIHHLIYIQFSETIEYSE